jgi:integrase/recombinase XerD
MASAKVVLFTSKTLKNGEHPIMLRVIHDRKTKYVNLNVNCHPDQWDEAKEIPKRKHPLFHEVSVLMSQRLNECKSIILDLEKENRPYSVEEITGILTQNQRKNKISVLEYFNHEIERLRSKDRLGYAAVFTSTRNYLKNFRKGKDFFFSDITPTFIVKFDEYLLEKGMKLNSAFMPMRTFKTLINYAKKEGLVNPDFAPFKEFSFSKYRRDKPRKRAIKRDDIRAIENLDLKFDTPVWHARNYFMFSYYCAGINFIDMAYLKAENIQQGRLIYIRRKTKEHYNLTILPPAMNIIQQYQSNYPNRGGYIFPILNETHQTLQSQDYRIDKVLKSTNKYLKEIAGLADLPVHLTTYVARHSFATNLKQSGASTAIISQALGHESERTTQIYLDSLENQVVDDAMKLIL